jgi:hypothetical protein
LIDLGHDVEVIDYQCSFFNEQYKKYSLTNLPNAKKFASILIHNGNVKYNGHNFDKFVEDNIPTSVNAYTPSDIDNIDGLYEIFITGSDQVWSPYCSGFDKTYFLDFVKKSKKCAYSASFGVDTINLNFQSDYKNLFSDFSNVTLREESGKKLFQNLTGREENVTLDPTLLLDSSEWQYLVNDKYKNKKFLLVYMIAESRNTLKLASSIAEERGLEVIYLSDRLFKRSCVTTLSQTSVEDWLSLFFYADTIVTNSFHGIAYSINFNKNFYVQFLPGRAKTNTRITNILNCFGLDSRLLPSKATNVKFCNITNYDEINLRLMKLRRESILALESFFA